MKHISSLVKEAVFIGVLFMWIFIFTAIAAAFHMDYFGVYWVIVEHKPMLNAVSAVYFYLVACSALVVLAWRVFFWVVYLSVSSLWIWAVKHDNNQWRVEVGSQ